MKRWAASRAPLHVAPARRANHPTAACAEELKAIYLQPARGAAPHKHAGETHSAPAHAAPARQPASARPRSSVPPARLTRRELAEVPLRDLVMIIQGLASEQAPPRPPPPPPPPLPVLTGHVSSFSPY